MIARCRGSEYHISLLRHHALDRYHRDRQRPLITKELLTQSCCNAQSLNGLPASRHHRREFGTVGIIPNCAILRANKIFVQGNIARQQHLRLLEGVVARHRAVNRIYTTA